MICLRVVASRDPNEFHRLAQHAFRKLSTFTRVFTTNFHSETIMRILLRWQVTLA